MIPSNYHINSGALSVLSDGASLLPEQIASFVREHSLYEVELLRSDYFIVELMSSKDLVSYYYLFQYFDDVHIKKVCLNRFRHILLNEFVRFKKLIDYGNS